MFNTNLYLRKHKGMKAWQMILYDVFAIWLTYGLAIATLTLSGASAFNHRTALMLVPIITVFKIIIYIISKIYRLIMDNAGFDEVFKIAIMVSLSNVLIAAITIAIPNFQFIPEIYLLFTTVFEVFVMVIPRILKRILSYFSVNKTYLSGKRTLLIGAGAGGKLVLDEIRNNPSLLNNPIAYVDDDETKISHIMSGFPILGPIKETPHIIDNYNIEVIKEFHNAKIKTYPRELMQVFINIIKNSKEAIVENSSKDKKIFIKVNKTQNDISIKICDTGGGIKDEILNKIFDPYFSTKSAKNGTGIGLYMSKTIVQKHLNGTLRAYNIDNGICLEISLPLDIENFGDSDE